jgi:hypothetical protein
MEYHGFGHLRVFHGSIHVEGILDIYASLDIIDRLKELISCAAVKYLSLILLSFGFLVLLISERVLCALGVCL